MFNQSIGIYASAPTFTLPSIWSEHRNKEESLSKPNYSLLALPLSFQFSLVHVNLFYDLNKAIERDYTLTLLWISQTLSSKPNNLDQALERAVRALSHNWIR